MVNLQHCPFSDTRPWIYKFLEHRTVFSKLLHFYNMLTAILNTQYSETCCWQWLTMTLNYNEIFLLELAHIRERSNLINILLYLAQLYNTD